MTAAILAVRPEPGLAATMAAGEALGLTMIGYPLFEVRARAWECPDAADIDALVIGTANAIRQGGAGLERLLDKPVHAVGEATADAARAAGFSVATVGTGGLQGVLDTLAGPQRLLRIAGAEHVPLDPPPGITIAAVIAYETAALTLPEPLRGLGALDLVVLLHSAAAAAHFARESRRMAFDRRRVTLAVIGPRVAAAAGEGWRAVHVSPAPNDQALLEMVRDTCI